MSSSKKIHLTFQSFTPEATGLVAFLTVVRVVGPNVFPPTSIAAFLSQAWENSPLNTVFPRFANLSMWTAADESEFDAVFALGPGAFSVLTQFLMSVYDVFCKELMYVFP